MGRINLANSKGRDAQVYTRSITIPLRVRWLDEQNRQAESVKILCGTLDRDADALAARAGGLEKVADLLIQGDPEVDIETYGSFLRNTSKVYIDSDRKIVHRVTVMDVLKNPDGTERERRLRQLALPNVDTEMPLQWSGKLMKKEKIFNKFVFSSKMQIIHYNGLTYDFLYNMAKELEEKESLMLVGAGPKSSQPLIFRRGGSTFRGFLEGKTQGDKYALILHLSNMELKAPEPLTTESQQKG